MKNENDTFDLIVIGSGTGGYPAAIKAAQMGMKVAIVEAKETGGTCLNRGCIPSKTLIASAEIYEYVKHASAFGINVENVTFDYTKMVDRKDHTVANIRNNLEGLLAANGITLIRGFAKFLSPREIKVTGQQERILYAEKSIIATGSEPRNIPKFPFDWKKIHDSTSLLNLRQLPKSIAIIGGGVIGCEFASLMHAFGVHVSIFEMMPSILPMEAKNISSTISAIFEKQGIEIFTQVVVDGIDTNEQGITVRIAGGQNHQAEIALVAVGRSLNVENLGLDKAGVILAESGLVAVNDKMETSSPGIYACGDIASRWWLAHVASHQGLVAASNAAGKPARMHYNSIPNVIFTTPEIGSVGMTLDQAISNGYNATVGSFPFHALGKSQASLQTEGFAQIVADKRTGQILGAQVIGHNASTLVAEMGVVIANELTIESVTESIHAHPTVAEAWLEAALVANDTPLHLPPKRRAMKSKINS